MEKNRVSRNGRICIIRTDFPSCQDNSKGERIFFQTNFIKIGYPYFKKKNFVP